ncbi:isoprenylcysteine carboxylmethyltransferase family protein [Cryobacterium melibiosiphilum]|uniref:Isoprenylcysteine carboxylmethyltransferase family protein n=1 Tax=Cryobacterium melibiosiphilum TaxID=995039 RepID=A0A3A5MAL6_9MICO|nr:isoprenylcysteine carboxylmethyltransferase family protein [Cryobacterium melibiosiphilum]RJT85666.1 isoprenylcysteine carboxylmethyltransferase family protein [Cryobacterium melibiosiphilum]
MNRSLARGLVALQVVLLLTLLLLPAGSLWPPSGGVLAAEIVLAATGLGLALLGAIGLGRSLTASPIPREDAALVTSGVYAVVRSPIYTGLMTGGFALVLTGASVAHVVAWIALVVLLALKARWEERMLLVAYPAYRAYGARVGRFLPWVGRLRAD